MLAATLTLGCGGDDGATADAGLDAIRRLALTVDSASATVRTNTRSVKVTIEANGTTRMDTFPVAGLPATVDLPQPIQLSDWNISVDGLDMNGTIIGRGTNTVPSRTAETTVTLGAI